MNIRQAKACDVPALARIESDSFDDPWSEAEIVRDVASERGIYVAAAECGDEIAGYADMRVIAGEAELYNIAVAPGYRQQGIGGQLMKHMIGYAADEGCGVLRLEVRAGNEAALHLYKKLGFAEVGLRRGYYDRGREDAVLMDLVIRP